MVPTRLTEERLAPEVDKAFTKSLELWTPAPLTKEILRSKIHLKRLNDGKQELKADFIARPNGKLRLDEHERIARRREVNRIAARKFRKKQKNIVQDLEQRVRELENENKNLIEEIKRLREIIRFPCQHDNLPGSVELGTCSPLRKHLRYFLCVDTFIVER